MEANLLFDGPEAGKELYNQPYVIDKPVLTLGRANDRDIQVPRVFLDISRDHCNFYYENGRFLLRDSSSTGTFVNDSRVPSGVVLRLNDGDNLRFGSYLTARFKVRKGLIDQLKCLFG
jgi:predicted component of type VI protein secretion system